MAHLDYNIILLNIILHFLYYYTLWFYNMQKLIPNYQVKIISRNKFCIKVILNQNINTICISFVNGFLLILDIWEQKKVKKEISFLKYVYILVNIV